GAVVVGILVAEIIEQQERVEFVGLAEAEGPVEPDAGALDGGLGGADALDWADGYGGAPFLDER
ncbi:MAG: hypothetical protein V3R71_09340, partial [Gemmatimonadales bacterium]